MSSALATRTHQTLKLESPRKLRERLVANEGVQSFVARSRTTIRSILKADDQRLLVVVGPCSVHDPEAALRYAEKLVRMSESFTSELFLVMRVYFEKPRTSVGWKGLISDPGLDGGGNILRGLFTARSVLLGITELGLPAATEMLDPLVPAYLADLVSWAAIGARTTESQTHRQLASALPMPVGFKNGTDGSLSVALNAMHAARQSHSVLGIDDDGHVSSLVTRGNSDSHLVLRGGSRGPNYRARDVARAAAQLRAARLPERILIDCAHGNSQKDPRRQPEVLENVAAQVRAGATRVLGVMIESNLVAGNQPLKMPVSALRFGQSITDACVNLQTTRSMLEELAHAWTTRKNRRDQVPRKRPRQSRLQPLS